MESIPKISIIVPIYNVEEYLVNCINLILKCTIQDFELILVNDGSPDKCGEICEQVSKKYNSIRVVHKKNGGLSSARNAGLEIATGKYILFIDPDDEFNQDYIKKLYNFAEENNCDAVVSGYKTVPNNNIMIPNFSKNNIMNGRDFVLSSKNIHSKNDLCFVWRYIYKLSTIKKKNIRFNEKVFYGEDVIFNLEYLLESERVAAISDILYHYRVNNPNSLMRIAYKPKLEGSLVNQYNIRKDLSLKHNLLEDSHFRRDMANYYIEHIYHLMISNLKNSEDSNKRDAFYRIVKYSMFTENIKVIGFSYGASTIKEYLYYVAFKLKLYPILFNTFMREVKRESV
ncbi:glycosyltransferase [Metabacillus halosaccharovorans]|uniref:glycosyltransferase n=1 Tax=Metabacillus halosaccharovorans TaxID=930124 RepID=UPI0034CD051E